MDFVRNSEACTSCGACAEDCSPLRFGLVASQEAIANPDDPNCEQCGHCYSVCPSGAISAVNAPGVPAQVAGSGLIADTDRDQQIAPADLLALLAHRRSERKFLDRSVSKEGLSALLAAAAQIPSGGNARTVECTVLGNHEARRGLIAAIQGFYHTLLSIARSPLARLVVGAVLGKTAGSFLNDPEYRRRFVALVEAIDNGIDTVFYGAPVVLLFHSNALMPTPEEDSVIAAYNVVLLAATMGLGSCFVSMAQKAFAASRSVRRASGLGKGQRVLAVLAVGHPAITRRRSIVRPAVPTHRQELGA